MMQQRIQAVAMVVAAFLAGGMAPAWAAAPPSIVQSIEMQTPSAPKISPDGSQVIFEQSRTDWKANAYLTDLYIVTAAGGRPRLLSNGVNSARDAEWSPDGQWIAFLSDRPGILPDSPAGKTQLYVIPAKGGEARQLTRHATGVGAISWLPDASGLIFSAEDAEPQQLKDRKDTFGEYHVIHADYANVQLWQVALPNGAALPAAPRQLTKGPYSVGSFAISPDGSRVAFDAQRDPDLISAFTADLHVLTLKDGTDKTIVSNPGPDTDPVWSPDSQRIAFQASAKPESFFYSNRYIAIVDAGGGPARLVTASFDEDADPVRWTGTGLYFSARRKTEAGLFRFDPQSGAIAQVALAGTPLATRFSLSAGAEGPVAAYVGAGPNAFPEIHVAKLGPTTSAPTRLTQAGDQLAGFATAQREVVRWTSKDGTPIEGILYKPADYDARRAYPLLVVIHGGPTGIDTPVVAPDRYYPIERFVAKGALVLRPNYRGSAGYGEKFRTLNVRNLGVGDYADVISGVDALVARGMVDKTRVAAMGWSQGGYISAFITTTSDLFKAVSVGAGISDWATYYYLTDITPFTRQYLQATPWADPQIYRKTSPISYVNRARTPTLIQHGGLDRRVPLANAFELRQALDDKGVPVKMVVYDGFGHQINKPKQLRAVMEENLAWFSHYLWDEPLPADLTPDAKPQK
jgi:dipeptidyl aminopeptidase/acylaminoacyl peptidase